MVGLAESFREGHRELAGDGHAEHLARRRTCRWLPPWSVDRRRSRSRDSGPPSPFRCSVRDGCCSPPSRSTPRLGINRDWLRPTTCIWSFLTRLDQSFSACMKMSSRPAASSKRSSLKPPLLGEVSLLKVLTVCVFGELVGDRLRLVVDATHDDGLIGVAVEEGDEDLLADARDVDATVPGARPSLAHPHPARAVSRRAAPRGPRGYCTLTRPYSSVWISSPEGPTMVATCTPQTRGFGVTCSGR